MVRRETLGDGRPVPGWAPFAPPFTFVPSGGTAGLAVLDDQLHGVPAAVFVGRQAIHQALARRWRHLAPAAEMDGRQRLRTALQAQGELQMARTDDAPVHDGEFADISLVPHQAMTLTIPALMSCRCAVGIVPLDRKAKAVHDALYGPISEKCPASILRTHDDAALFLDEGAASLLRI